MNCSYCGSDIGWWRAARDREYCCDAHRRAMVARSAYAARDDERFYTWEDPWAPLENVPVSRSGGLAARRNDTITTSLLALLLLCIVMFGATTTVPTFSLLKFKKSWELQAEPQAISNWKSLPVSGGAMLRMWPETAGFRDYRFSFTTQLDGSPLGWVVRAVDAKNYCALRLVRSDGGYRLQRSAVIAGDEREKSTSELLAGLTPKSKVAVSVEARGDAVITSINGRPVDSWVDPRLRSGAAGWLTLSGHDPQVESAKVTLLARNGETQKASLLGF